MSNFIKSRVTFSKPIEALEIKTNYSKKFNNGIFKYLGRITKSSLSTSPSDIGSNFNLENNNKFLLSTYKTEINNSTRLQLGFSYSENKDDAKIIFINDNLEIDVPAYDDLRQFRTVLTKDVLSKSKIKLGYHIFNQNSNFKYYTITNPDDNQGWIGNNIDFNEFTLTIHTFSRNRGRKEAKNIMARIYALLHNATLSVTGANHINTRFEFHDVIKETDGLTYHGVQRFRTILHD